MHTIQGPIKFEKGKEVPQKIKDYIKANGIKLSFSATNFTYSNTDLDSWLRIKEGKKVYKMDRVNNRIVEATQVKE